MGKHQCPARVRFLEPISFEELEQLSRLAVPYNSAKVIIHPQIHSANGCKTETCFNDRTPEDFLDSVRDPESLCKVMTLSLIVTLLCL